MFNNGYTSSNSCPFCGSHHVVDEGMWEEESREWSAHWSCTTCCKDWDNSDFITHPSVFRFAERQYGFDLGSVWKVTHADDRIKALIYFNQQESGKEKGHVIVPLSDFGDLQIEIWTY